MGAERLAALLDRYGDATVVNDGSLNDLSMQAERIATYVKTCYLRNAKLRPTDVYFVPA